MATTIFVGQLSYEATEDDVAQVFTDNNFCFEKITIPYDYENECIKGIAFVDMQSAEDVQKAIYEIGNVEIKGRKVQMIEKNPDKGKGKGKGYYAGKGVGWHKGGGKGRDRSRSPGGKNDWEPEWHEQQRIPYFRGRGGCIRNPGDVISGRVATGEQICFAWNRERGCEGGCDRVHVCELCMLDHPKRECPDRKRW